MQKVPKNKWMCKLITTIKVYSQYIIDLIS